MPIREIKILGAGVSGLATSILLAARGHRVIVYDRRPQPGGRFAGGFQVLENSSTPEDVLAEMARRGIPIDCDLTPLRAATFVGDRQRPRETHSVDPYGYLMRRGGEGRTLDAGLLRAATEAGVDIEFSTPVRDDDVDVIASGPTRVDGVARELTFTTDAPDTIVVLFSRITRSGYGYVFIRNGFGTMGVAIVREMTRLKEASRDGFARLTEFVRGSLEPAHEHTHFMNFIIPRHLFQGGKWHVGEAAGVQDFLFGLGNRLAFRTAAFAAAGIAGEPWDAASFYRDVQRPMLVSVLGRRIFEAADRYAPSALLAYLSHGDLRKRLLFAQRPDAAKLLLARALTWTSGKQQQPR